MRDSNSFCMPHVYAMLPTSKSRCTAMSHGEMAIKNHKIEEKRVGCFLVEKLKESANLEGFFLFWPRFQLKKGRREKLFFFGWLLGGEVVKREGRCFSVLAKERGRTDRKSGQIKWGAAGLELVWRRLFVSF